MVAKYEYLSEIDQINNMTMLVKKPFFNWQYEGVLYLLQHWA